MVTGIIRKFIFTIILAGAVLTLSSGTALAANQPSVARAPLVHTVQSGDTLRRIAVRYETNWQEIVATNGIGYPYTLAVGQSLVISRPPEARSPQQVVERFYAWYLAEARAGNHPLESGLYQASPYLSSALVQRVDDELMTLQRIDPFVCAPKANGSVTVEGSRTTGAEFRATLRSSASGRTSTVSAGEESGTWKITGIECGN